MVGHDPNEIIRLSLAGTAAQWQAFVDFCDAQGIHRIVRPFIDQIVTQANAPQQAPPDMAVPEVADAKEKPPPGGRGRWQKNSEEATAAE